MACCSELVVATSSARWHAPDIPLCIALAFNGRKLRNRHAHISAQQYIAAIQGGAWSRVADVSSFVRTWALAVRQPTPRSRGCKDGRGRGDHQVAATSAGQGVGNSGKEGTKGKEGEEDGDQEEEEGEGVSLGTAVLPPSVDLKRFEELMCEWAFEFASSTTLPLPAPLTVERIDSGVSFQIKKLEPNGSLAPSVAIEVTISPAKGEVPPLFKAVRVGTDKKDVPPGEPVIMKSMLAAIRKNFALAEKS